MQSHTVTFAGLGETTIEFDDETGLLVVAAGDKGGSIFVGSLHPDPEPELVEPEPIPASEPEQNTTEEDQ